MIQWETIKKVNNNVIIRFVSINLQVKNNQKTFFYMEDNYKILQLFS